MAMGTAPEVLAVISRHLFGCLMATVGTG